MHSTRVQRKPENLKCGKESKDRHSYDVDDEQYMQNCIHKYWESHQRIRAWIARVEIDQERLDFMKQWYQHRVPDQHHWMARYIQLWHEEALFPEASFLPHCYDELARTFDSSSVGISSSMGRKRSKHGRKSSRSSRRKHRRLRRTSIASAAARNIGSAEDSVDESDDVEFEFEMSDELLQFFKQTAEHRKERAQVKAAQLAGKSDEGPYLDLEAACSGRGRATILPPSEQKSTLRNVEMKQLYGAGAAMIQGMETAMQLTFDRNTDKYKPRLWPALPLNIRFDDLKNGDSDEVNL